MERPILAHFRACLLAVLIAGGSAPSADDIGASVSEAGMLPPVPTDLQSEEFQAIKALVEEADLDEKSDRLEDAYRKYQQVSEFYGRHPELSDCRNGCTCKRFYVEGKLGYIARLWRRNDEALAHYRRAMERIDQSGSPPTLSGDVGRYSFLVSIHDLLAAQGKRGLVAQTEMEMAACEARIQARVRNAPQALDTARSELSREHGCLVLRVKAVGHFLRAEFAQARQTWAGTVALARAKKLNRDEAHALLGQAEVALLLEDYEAGVPLIEEALRLPPHRGCNRCRPEAMARLALGRARRDGFSPKDLEDADAAVAQLKALGIEDDQERMLRALLLSLAGRGDAAVAEAEAVRRRVREAGQRLLEADAICVKARVAKEQGKLLPELGGELQQALLLYREMGYKLKEPFVYLYYGLWLAQNGKATEALYVLDQGLRLCELLDFANMTARILAARAGVACAGGTPSLLAEVEKRLDTFLAGHPGLPPTTRTAVAAWRGEVLLSPVAGRPPQPRAAATSQRDRAAARVVESAAWIQPIQAESVRLADVAEARFSLQNLADTPTSGRLGFRGVAIREYCWGQDELRVDLGPAAEMPPNGVAELPVDLAAGRLCWIVLAAKEFGGEGCGPTIDLLWNGEPHAMWSLGGPADPRRISVTNSGLFALGPFVRVPVAHLIFNPGSTRTVANLRVITSRPCRVEFIDPGSGRILGVDAEGNGSFAEVGDDLWNDCDADGFPDFLLPAGPASGVVEFWLYPRRQTGSGSADELIEVDLFLRHGGDWMKEAVDHIWGRAD